VRVVFDTDVLIDQVKYHVLLFFYLFLQRHMNLTTKQLIRVLHLNPLLYLKLVSLFLRCKECYYC